MSRLEKEVALEEELDSVKEGYDLLDRNWSAMHEATMEMLRAALSMPDATVPEMVAAIERLQHIEKAAKPVLANMEGTCGDECKEPSFAGFMHGTCPKCTEEYDMPVGALKDQTLMCNLRDAILQPTGYLERSKDSSESVLVDP